MGVGRSVAVTPAFIRRLVGPAGVDKPTGLGIAGGAKEFESFEASDVGKARHPGGESLDDLIAGLGWNLECVDLHNSHGEVVPPNVSAMAIRADAIGVTVADMAVAMAFYRQLGLEFPEGVEGEDHVEVTLPGDMRLMFDTVELMKRISDYHPPTGGHRITLGFVCDSPAEVDATHAALVAAGHRSTVEPWDAFWGQRYATVLDPDDNPVDLFAALPA